MYIPNTLHFNQCFLMGIGIHFDTGDKFRHYWDRLFKAVYLSSQFLPFIAKNGGSTFRVVISNFLFECTYLCKKSELN